MPRLAEFARAELIRAVAEGRFADRDELRAFVRAMGLWQTRDGDDYIGVRTFNGVRFRVMLTGPLVRAPDPAKLRKRRKFQGALMAPSAGRPMDLFSIYIIAAVSPDDRIAAYVGTSTVVRRRMAEHLYG